LSNNANLIFCIKNEFFKEENVALRKYTAKKVDTFCILMYTDTGKNQFREKGRFHVSAEIHRLDETLGFYITGSDCSALKFCDCILGAAWNSQSILAAGVSGDQFCAAFYRSDY